MMEWKISPQFEGMILRNYMHKELGISRNILKALKFDGGKISINDVQVDVRYRLKEGDLLRVNFPKEDRGFYMEAEDMELDIVYEDDHIIVLNKQAGIVAVPTPHTPKGTIANGLLGYYDQKNLSYTAHVVTRLDKDTSGLMLIGKHRYSHSLLAKSQEKNKIDRSYIALVHGEMPDKKGTIDAPIGRKEGSFMEREVREGGRQAITHYEVISKANDKSLVQAKLETGRTHQIRVHFASLNHPIVGDSLYGGQDDKISRQALHCQELIFPHPITEETIHLKSEVPSDIKNLLEK